MSKKGLNVNNIKYANISAVLNCIRKTPMSRAQISQKTGLSKSAITLIVKQLIDDNQVKEIGRSNTESGRHPILLDIVSSHRFAFGISLHRKNVSVCVVNLKLESIDSEFCDISRFSSPEDALGWAIENCFHILEKNQISPDKCIGIGVSAPGPIDYKNGIILTPPNFNLFHNFNVKEFLSKYTSLPVFLNNAPMLMALYEHEKRQAEISNYIFLSIDEGIGAAIVQNGVINLGSDGFSGEIGHTTVDMNGLPCSCGNIGCLERYVTKKAIQQKYECTYESIIDRAYRNEMSAVDAVRHIAFVLSTGIINATNLLDIEYIIVSGELNYRNELLLNLLQNNINSRSLLSKTHNITIIPPTGEYTKDIAYSAVNVINKYYNDSL